MRTVLFFCLGFALATINFTYADVTLPKDILDCPKGTVASVFSEKITHCIEKTKGNTKEEDLLTNGATKVAKIIYINNPNQTMVSLYQGYADFPEKFYGDAASKFSPNAKGLLPDVTDQSNPYILGVDPTTKTLTTPIKHLWGDYEWFFHPTKETYVTLFTAKRECTPGGKFSHVENTNGLTVERVMQGQYAWDTTDSSCKPKDMIRPFTATMTCTDLPENASSVPGKKLEFIFKLPTASAAIKRGDKDPLYLEFKVDGQVVLVKKLAKDYNRTTNYYEMADILRSESNAKPLNQALNTAFECFDHLAWKEKGDAREAAGSRNYYDEKIVRDNLKDVDFNKLPKLTKDSTANQKEIKKIAEAGEKLEAIMKQASKDCPECEFAPAPSPTPSPKAPGKKRK